MLVLSGGLLSAALAQPDFASFKITSVDGHVEASSQSDTVKTTFPDSTGTGTNTQSQRQRDRRLEASVTVHSYVYHPKFMTLDVGLGAISALDNSSADPIETSTRDTLYNFSAHATVLIDKPVHGTVFIEHINTTPNVTAEEVFTQQNRRYGFTTSVGAPVLPIGLELLATREHNKGSSVTRVVDDEISRFNLTGSKSFGDIGTTQITLYNLRQDSSSGMVNLPIVNALQDYKSFSVDNRFKFGQDMVSELNNHIEYSKQAYTLNQGHTPDLSDLRVTLDYYGRQGRELSTFANAQFSRNRQDDVASFGNSVGGGARWSAAQGLDFNGGLHLNDTRSPQFTSVGWNVDGAVRYEKPLKIGTGQASYTLQYAHLDQNALQAQVDILGERLSLTGTTATRLSRSRVVGSSIKVYNRTRTQQFVEGVDYTISLVGTSTRLQRLITGSILDGEDLLVDYAFDTGGTYISGTTDQALGLGWSISRLVSIYARYNASTPTLLSGEPTSPLNTVRSRSIGLRADVPLPTSFELIAGGSFERENRDETVAPYVRTAAEAYVQGDIPASVNMNYRLGSRRTRVESDIATQTMDQQAYDLLFGLRLDSGLYVNATGLYERDSGGIELRERRTLALKANWRYRRLSLSADLTRTLETQGLNEQDRTMGRLTLRRDL